MYIVYSTAENLRAPIFEDLRIFVNLENFTLETFLNVMQQLANNLFPMMLRSLIPTLYA